MVFMGELIGNFVKVVKARNKVLFGMEGKVIDETKNMLIFQNKKMIQKNAVWLKVENNGNLFEIDGKLLVGRPEDRLKK